MHLNRGAASHPVKRCDEVWASLKTAFESRQNDDRLRGPPPGFDPAFDEGTVSEDGVYWAVKNWKYLGVKGPMQDRNGEVPDGKNTG